MGKFYVEIDESRESLLSEAISEKEEEVNEVSKKVFKALDKHSVDAGISGIMLALITIVKYTTHHYDAKHEVEFNDQLGKDIIQHIYYHLIKK